MLSATLPSKFQLFIPRAICEELGIGAGQKFALIAKGSVLELVPLRSIKDARGMFKGADSSGYRDRGGRYLMPRRVTAA